MILSCNLFPEGNLIGQQRMNTNWEDILGVWGYIHGLRSGGTAGNVRQHNLHCLLAEVSMLSDSWENLEGPRLVAIEVT